MLQSLSGEFRILATQASANDQQIASLTAHYPDAPLEYIELAREATELELQHVNGQYIRIWGPDGCKEMDDGYDISKRIPGAIPIGDDGGGHVLFLKGGNLYKVGFGDLDLDDAVLLAPSFKAFVENASGLDKF